MVTNNSNDDDDDDDNSDDKKIAVRLIPLRALWIIITDSCFSRVPHI